MAAEAAQQWDDWALASEMKQPREDHPAKRPRLRVILQHHEAGGGVAQQRELLLPLGFGTTVTLGFQVEGGELLREGRLEGSQGHGLAMVSGPAGDDVGDSGATAGQAEARGRLRGQVQHGPDGRDDVSAGSRSTERVRVESPPRRETAEGVDLGNSVGNSEHVPNVVSQPSDVAVFLSSPQGSAFYQQWASGSVSDAQVVRSAGAIVLEAFQTQRIFLAAVHQ